MHRWVVQVVVFLAWHGLREMAEYLTYLQYLATQDRKTIVKIIGDVLLGTYQTIEHSPIQREKKNINIFLST